MKLNLFCYLIFSLNIWTITSNIVYPSTLSHDHDVEVLEAHATVKRNITQVPDYEEDVDVEAEEEHTDEFPGVEFPRNLFKVKNENPCIPSPCGRNFWPWGDVFNGNVRYICLPNYIRSPPKCTWCWKPCPVVPEPTPCSPSPCGPHSQCREDSLNAICRCQSNFIGRPPNCRRECTINSECASNKACLNRICVDPCVYKCARNANCTVIAHNPICSCQDGFTGDPFTNCMPLSIPTERPEVNPCIPFPCGPYSQCQEINGRARCTCLPNYSSSPPRCRLDCTIDSQCNPDKACINNRCTDPCPTACGNYAQCIVKNHVPYCTCLPDSCQALDQTFDFPRYPELGHKFGYPKEEAVSEMESRPKETGGSVKPPCSVSCAFDNFYAFCPSGTERLNSFCVEIDEDHDNN